MNILNKILLRLYVFYRRQSDPSIAGFYAKAVLSAFIFLMFCNIVFILIKYDIINYLFTPLKAKSKTEIAIYSLPFVLVIFFFTMSYKNLEENIDYFSPEEKSFWGYVLVILFIVVIFFMLYLPIRYGGLIEELET